MQQISLVVINLLSKVIKNRMEVSYLLKYINMLKSQNLFIFPKNKILQLIILEKPLMFQKRFSFKFDFHLEL